MVEKFFLALDYRFANEIVEKGVIARDFLRGKFGEKFAAENLGFKLNVDAFTNIDRRYAQNFKNIFADLKISHGADTGARLMENISGELHISYVTVPANLGPDILKEYVREGAEHGIKIVAFTAHTKIAPEHIQRIYNRSLADVIFTLGQIASEAGCDAMVCEGKMLEDARIRKLPIKKLVTGIRIDVADADTQKRVTKLDELSKLVPYVDYAVISSKIVNNYDNLERFVSMLK